MSPLQEIRFFNVRVTDNVARAVMDATSNLASQEVFNLAREADPEGLRTVGVITKCDAVQEGDEEIVLNIAKNSVEELKHGWFAVKNRSTREIREGVTIPQRHERERVFFSTAPWNQIASERRGVGHLKKRLGHLLFEHIRKEFPSLIKDIEKLHETTSRTLDGMGQARDTSSNQRQYLTSIATKYQRHVSDSLAGHYSPDLSDDHVLKLRKHLRDLDDRFDNDMRYGGHTRIFRVIEDEDAEFSRNPGKPAEESIYDWIRRVYRNSRGAELPGTIHPAVMESLFRQQSSNWKGIAEDYFQHTKETIEHYNQAILYELVADREVLARMQSFLEAKAVEAFASAATEVQKVINDERGMLKTVNHYFAETLQNLREERVMARLKASFNDGDTFNMDAMAKTIIVTNVSYRDANWD